MFINCFQWKIFDYQGTYWKTYFVDDIIYDCMTCLVWMMSNMLWIDVRHLWNDACHLWNDACSDACQKWHLYWLICIFRLKNRVDDACLTGGWRSLLYSKLWLVHSFWHLEHLFILTPVFLAVIFIQATDPYSLLLTVVYTTETKQLIIVQ